MTKETKSINVTAYRDSKGNPCCAGDFRTGAVCVFYRTYKLGTGETCAFSDGLQLLQRRDGGEGTLIPCKECLVWGDLSINSQRLD